MPTVIDSLIVELNLDPSKFTKGQKEAIARSKDWEEEIVKQHKAIEEQGKKSAEWLGVFQNKLLGVAAIITGGLGIEKLVGQITKQDAATGRLSYTLGTNVTALDKWRNAAFLAGGSSEGITGFISNLTKEYANLSIHGTSEIVPFLRALQVEFQTSTGAMVPFDELIKRISDRVSKLDPVIGAQFLRSIGADEGSINLIIRGRAALDGYLSTAEKFGNLTPQQAENARKLAESYNQLSLAMTEWSRVAINSVTPALIKIQDFITKAISDRNQNIPHDSLMGRLMTKWGMWKDETKTSPEQKGGTSAFPSTAERVAYYRAEAAKRGMSPDVIETLVRSEGLKKYTGDDGSSFGDFQLHYGGVARGGNAVPGLGDSFTKKTGLDARDPSTWKEQAQFSLDRMKEHGLSEWHGWKGAPWAGIAREGGTTTNDVRIQNINIYPPNGDSDSIAASIGPSIKRQGLSYQGQAGPQ